MKYKYYVELIRITEEGFLSSKEATHSIAEKITDRLNELSDIGWELYNVVPLQEGHPPKTYYAYHYFRAPVDK